ncbi:SOSS complex subunit C-like isoform X1 [Nomia melanderi]|uniref:SOSS complex subunit C-like isoform X1 n=1 Tax=Nomia melanderi TaxID=2448451 RepID=UPI003FCE7F6F
MVQFQWPLNTHWKGNHFCGTFLRVCQFEEQDSKFLMAFSQSNSRELQNRKILEELQLKKQMLLKQGVAPTLNTPLAVTPAGSPSNLPSTQPSDGIAMSASQRAALHNAHAASSGYFVTQDSSFGNLILPVLPRFDAK